LGCTHIEINKQLVKEEYIKIKPILKLFDIFNANGTKNRKVTWFASLKLKINRYMKKINIVVIDLNRIYILLEYNWLVKHNLEVN